MAEIGAILLFLIVVFLFGRIWFIIVESVISFFKRLFNRRRDNTIWYEFPQEHEDEEDKKLD